MRIFSRIVLESESAAGRPIVRLAPRRLLTEPLLFPPNGRDVQHVVPADEAVAIFRLELAVHVLGAERERHARGSGGVSRGVCGRARERSRAPAPPRFAPSRCSCNRRGRRARRGSRRLSSASPAGRKARYRGDARGGETGAGAHHDRPTERALQEVGRVLARLDLRCHFALQAMGI